MPNSDFSQSCEMALALCIPFPNGVGTNYQMMSEFCQHPPESSTVCLLPTLGACIPKAIICIFKRLICRLPESMFPCSYGQLEGSENVCFSEAAMTDGCWDINIEASLPPKA